MQCEGLAHRSPPATAHADHDRWLQVAKQREQMSLGAGTDPARPDRRAHLPFFDAQNRVGHEYRRFPIGVRWVCYVNARRGQQLLQIFVGLVVRIVAPTVADEIADIAKILADHEDLGSLVAKPLLPVADDLGIELEFGAAPDLPGAALDTNSASLPGLDKRTIFVHARHLPDPGLRRASTLALRPSTARGTDRPRRSPCGRGRAPKPSGRSAAPRRRPRPGRASR